MSAPDFFIVGAPKCGTTAMYTYLRQHPDVFMPFHKEPLYFGADLGTRYGRMSKRDYLRLFAEARSGQRVGEASAWYLYSRLAAREIAEFNPAAQIIIMLRNPVDMMYAQHAQLVFNGQENLHDFAEALSAEPARRQGRRIPAGPVRVENLFYREAAHFSDQVGRYLDTFGRDRLHVIVYDDLRRDTASVYRDTLRFLEIDPDFRPDFAVVNESKRVRNPALQRLVYAPPPPVRRLIPVLRRFPLVHAMRGALLSLNSTKRPRPPLDPDLRRSLQAEFADEVRRLGSLIGRDLTAWSHM